MENENVVFGQNILYHIYCLISTLPNVDKELLKISIRSYFVLKVIIDEFLVARKILRHI